MLNKNVLSSLGNWNTSIFRLRNQYVGSQADRTFLKDSGFDTVEVLNDFYLWEKTWHEKDLKIQITIAPLGTICNVNLLTYKDIQTDDYIGAPYLNGWFIDESCSEEIEHEINGFLANIQVKKPELNPQLAFQETLERICDTKHLITENKDYAYWLCHYVWELQQSKPAIARVVTTTMIRHINSIKNPLPLWDLILYCGRLGLLSECRLAIEYALEKTKNIPATIWCNMGAVLTDNLHISNVGYHCFLKAIEMDSSMLPPRQGIWIAGFKQMRNVINQHDYEEVVHIAETIEKYGWSQFANHAVYSLKGLALEMIKRNKEAKSAYMAAIEIEPNCTTSKDALKRFDSTENSDDAYSQINKILDNTMFDEFVDENNYKWV
jgi:hypothetical protein